MLRERSFLHTRVIISSLFDYPSASFLRTAVIFAGHFFLPATVPAIIFAKKSAYIVQFREVTSAGGHRQSQNLEDEFFQDYRKYKFQSKIKYDLNINDAKGNVWMFGSFGYDGAGQYDELNDLLNFRPVVVSSAIYTFTGNGNWTIASNWGNGLLPLAVLPSGAEIIINPPATGECVLNTTETIQPAQGYCTNGKET